jgi:hypothetical protein
MTPQQALQQHQQVCDELHALSLEENSFLQQHRHAPGPEFVARKQALLERLDAVLAGLRAAPKGSLAEPSLRSALDATRARVLQILQLERENEQLLLRASLSRPATTPTLSPTLLEKIYQRH